MGKLEKIVVLSVLFLISIIIVLSLSTGSIEEDSPTAGLLEAPGQTTFETRLAEAPVDRSPETSTPLERPAAFTPAAPVSDGLVVELPGESSAGRGSSPGRAPGRTTGHTNRATDEGLGLLSSSVAPVEAAAPVGLQVEADWDLKTVVGLERSSHPAFLIHRCTRGDTFEGLALELYGDASKAGLLERNNEGMRLEAGLEILIPVRDDRGPDAGEYVVQEGESLWVISKRFYGAGSRWGEIFEANRDVLTTPEAVRQGMTLRIP